MITITSTLISTLQKHPIIYCFILGLAFTSGFAPFGFWPLALIAFAEFLRIVVACKKTKHTAYTALSFSMGYWLSSIYWLPKAFYVDMQSWLMALLTGVPALFALCLYLSLFIIVPSIIANQTSKKVGKTPAILIFSILFLLGEFLRSYGDLAFPWNLSGYIFAQNIEILQLASTLKIWGLCALVLVFTSLWQGGIKLKLTAIIIIISALVHGHYVLYQNPQHPNAGLTKTFRLVNVNINQAHKWDPQKRYNFMQRHLNASINTQEDVIVWPETAVNFFPSRDSYIYKGIINKLNPNQILITGAPTIKGSKYLNSIISINQSEGLFSQYNKHILVPFGEYIPFRGIMPSFIQKMVHGRSDYTAGTEVVELEISKNLKALPLICFEGILPNFVQKNNTNQQFILNLTNDGWFNGTTAPYQHFYMAKVRALETGKPLIRVANSGISAIIDKHGREIQRLDISKPN